MLIALTGKLGSGKDTAADYLIQKYGYQKKTFAAPLKNTLSTLFLFENHQLYGTQEEKSKVDARWGISGREAMQWLGTDILRERFPDFFLTHFELSVDQTSRIVVSDLRFLNEAALIKKLGGYIVKINRDTGESNNHVSETELEQIEYHYVVNNTTTLHHLHQQLDAIVKDIRKDIYK